MTSVANWASQRRNSVRAGSSQRLTPTVEKNSDSDDDGEAAAWWRREHGAAADDAPAPAPRNRPAAADRQDDARWEGPIHDGGDRQPPRRSGFLPRLRHHDDVA